MDAFALLGHLGPEHGRQLAVRAVQGRLGAAGPEAVLHHHPAVKEAMVLGLPDPYRGEHPRAYVTLNADVTATGDELRDWLNPQLGRHERVDEVVVRLTMPKTMIGKLSRKDLLAEVTAETSAHP